MGQSTTTSQIAGISLVEFTERRRELMSMMDSNSIAILPSAAVQMRNSDVEYHFRQNSDFHYLTGFNESEAVLVLIPGREHGEAVLFCRERDHEYERWHGKVTGPDRARQFYGLDDAFPISDVDDILPGLIEGRSRLYYGMGVHQDFDAQIIEWVKSISTNQQGGAEPPGEFVQLGHFLHELRLFKSPKEIELMKRAAVITGQGHQRLLEVAQEGMPEYQLEAELNYTFACHGARESAYPAIVGSGENACILHYIENSGVLGKGELVLVDAGCELEGYAADVTRTFPVDAAFTDSQRALYEIVLAAQEAAIAAVEPGRLWDEPHDAAVRVITEGLIRLGLINLDLDEALRRGAYRAFYMHKTGHWLGLDVHDVGEYSVGGQPRVFEPGMVTTIEPGIYIDADAEGVPASYRGIGIRIEDNVLVTRKGNEVITAMIPKTIAEIERIRSEALAKNG